jgi:TPR repeat protein
MKRFVIVLSMLFLWAGTAGAVESDDKLSLLESAVEGDQNAQFDLAELYAEEAQEYNIIAPDMTLLEKAVHWYEKAAEKGHKPSQSALLDIYDFPYEDENPQWQKKWFILANTLASEGDRKAQFILGKHYSQAYNCDTDLKQCLDKAIHWYSRILKGLPSKQTTVFERYEVTTGAVTRQHIEILIARLKTRDTDTEEKQAKMDLLLSNAKETGSMKALIGLGDTWFNPFNNDQNIEMAAKAYKYAAEKNNPEAQIKFARLLYQHAKDRFDYQDAYFWAMAATMAQIPKAPELLSQIEKKFSSEHLTAMEADAKKGIKRLRGE